MAISVVDTGRRRAEKGLTFPSKPLLYVDDAIRVPQRDLEDNAQGRVSESVFFSFSTLHEILDVGNHIRLTDDTRDVRNHVLNSRVISASLGRPGRHIELKEPVTINLRHIKDQNMTDPICVFWDYEVHAWSDSGCKLVATNATGTTCQCNHLTNFALLMKYQEASALLSIRLDIVAYVVVSVVVIALLLVLIKVSLLFKLYSVFAVRGYFQPTAWHSKHALITSKFGSEIGFEIFSKFYLNHFLIRRPILELEELFKIPKS